MALPCRPECGRNHRWCRRSRTISMAEVSARVLGVVFPGFGGFSDVLLGRVTATTRTNDTFRRENGSEVSQKIGRKGNHWQPLVPSPLYTTSMIRDSAKS